MTTMTAEHLTRNPAVVRRALGNGDEVMLTFHGKPYARVIAHGRVEEERAELERLRAEVETLRALVGQKQEVPA
jgi:antitoxin (DNA-binding transcriptional repressor) of toxin-antitoxin stability system